MTNCSCTTRSEIHDCITTMHKAAFLQDFFQFFLSTDPCFILPQLPSEIRYDILNYKQQQLNHEAGGFQAGDGGA